MESNSSMSYTEIITKAQELIKSDNSVLNKLSEREQEIIKRRIGLFDGKEQPLYEVSEALGITRERVRQLEEKAYRKLLGVEK